MSRIAPFEENTIIVGDCLDIIKQMPDGCVDLVVTDPPFHVTITSQTKNTPAYRNLMAVGWQAQFNWIREAYRILREGSTLYVFTNDDDITFLRLALQDAGFRIYRRLHWIKTNPLPSYTKRNYRGGVELAYYCCKGITPSYFAERTQQELLSYWFFPIVGGNERTEHPTQKPVGLLMEWVNNSCLPSGIVFDPFIGSGTTAVAADRLGRKWFGCDISSLYVSLALERIEADRLKRSQLEMSL